MGPVTHGAVCSYFQTQCSRDADFHPLTIQYFIIDQFYDFIKM